jgi:F-type H+-transporting ATPase subunit b
MHLDLWTLALQAINAAVLIWLLARYLFRPVRAMIDQRRQAAEKLLADAEAARIKAAADATEMAQQRQGFAATGERILADAHAQAAADAAAQRAQAAQSITRMRQDAAAELAHERTAMQDVLAGEAADLAVTIARRLLARVPEPAATEALLHDLADRLAKLPESERARLAGAQMEIVTASPLSPAQQAACGTWLGTALAGTPLRDLTFHDDPALLAGVELRAPHTLIRNHWQADLERIARELRSSAIPLPWGEGLSPGQGGVSNRRVRAVSQTQATELAAPPSPGTLSRCDISRGER